MCLLRACMPACLPAYLTACLHAYTEIRKTKNQKQTNATTNHTIPINTNSSVVSCTPNHIITHTQARIQEHARMCVLPYIMFGLFWLVPCVRNSNLQAITNQQSTTWGTIDYILISEAVDIAEGKSSARHTWTVLNASGAGHKVTDNLCKPKEHTNKQIIYHIKSYIISYHHITL